jgi:tRNA wybutosine-synthesizing protein 3
MPRFDSEKSKVMKDYQLALKKKLIDEDIIPVLEIINSSSNYYTTSSCSGRILLLALASPGAKNKSNILGRWHDALELTAFESAIENWNQYKYLYFLAQSPILHVIARDIDSGIKLRNLGDLGGFKYSTIRSIKPIKHSKSTENSDYTDARVTVELLSTERLNIPIGRDGKVLIDKNYMNLLIELANDQLTEAQDKLKKLKEVLHTNLTEK